MSHSKKKALKDWLEKVASSPRNSQILIRFKAENKKFLKELSALTGKSITELIDSMVDAAKAD